ncbi:hypothetical protein CTA2_201 [Colletotrichum tanaceti]|nr:hypothetical protein CTA2_201 [Colletotrichum tanaceti]
MQRRQARPNHPPVDYLCILVAIVAVVLGYTLLFPSWPAAPAQPTDGGGKPAVAPRPASPPTDYEKQKLCHLERRLDAFNRNAGAVDLFTFLGVPLDAHPVRAWLSGRGDSPKAEKAMRAAVHEATTRFLDENGAADGADDELDAIISRFKAHGSRGRRFEGGGDDDNYNDDGNDDDDDDVTRRMTDGGMTLRRLAIDVGAFLLEPGSRRRYVKEVMGALQGRKDGAKRTAWMKKFCGQLWAN